ncbi:MAG TPA: hypothetical protein VHZ50_08295 [Puia sp.]|jgi:hypothetical protein|nr:hypothetical protein [Puia sp.]
MNTEKILAADSQIEFDYFFCLNHGLIGLKDFTDGNCDKAPDGFAA